MIPQPNRALSLALISWFSLLAVCGGLRAESVSTLLYAEDFEMDNPVLWMYGNRSDAQARTGKYSLQSLASTTNHRVTLSKGEGYFHAAGDNAKTRVQFSIFPKTSTSFQVMLMNQSLRTNMHAKKELIAGKWNDVTLTLTDFSSEKGNFRPGDIAMRFSVIASDSFWVDDIHMETDVLASEFAASRPRNLLNPIKLTEPGAKFQLKLIDEKNQEITPARISVSVNGKEVNALAGSLVFKMKSDIPLFFYSNGNCELETEPGKVAITVTKGLEYEFIKKEIVVQAGQNPDITIKMKKWLDLSRDGFFGADVHIHPNYAAAKYQITPEDVLMIARAEDIHVPNLLVANSGADTIFEYGNFSGHSHPLSDKNHILYWNEEYRSLAYGHMVLMRLKKLIYPVHNGFGQSGSPGFHDFPANLDIVKQVRAQNGVAIYHPFVLNGSHEESMENELATREIPVDAPIIGIDAMDIMVQAYKKSDLDNWHRLLNCGFKIPPSAGTDAMLAEGRITMGISRVYAKSGTPLNYDKWVDAYKAGKTFVTTGPYVWMTVNEKEPGAIISGERGKKLTLTIHAEAASQFGLQRMEIICNSEVVSSIDLQSKIKGELKCTVAVDSDSWITAQAYGVNPPAPDATFSLFNQFATTGPVYCDLKTPSTLHLDDANFFKEWIDQFELYLDKRNRYGSAENKDAIKALLNDARKHYVKLQEESKK